MSTHPQPNAFPIADPFHHRTPIHYNGPPCSPVHPDVFPGTQCISSCLPVPYRPPYPNPCQRTTMQPRETLPTLCHSRSCIARGLLVVSLRGLRVSRPIGSLVWAPTPEISVFVGGELLADDLGALRAYGMAAKACCAGTFSRFRDVLQNPPNL